MTERIRLIRDDELTGETRNLFDALIAMMGRIPNSYRVLARVPKLAKLLIPFNAAMQRQGAGSILTTKIKEMVVIKTSHLNGCRY